ncbi:MAG: hypothetical protein WA885_23455 [Phormidesmis sp.]
MAERPIKKSEREAAQQAEPAKVESAKVEPAKSNVPRPVKKGDRKDGGENQREGSSDDRDRSQSKGGKGGKGRGKGKGRDKDEAPRTPMNPALVRGPKPVAKSAEVEAAEEATAAEISETTGADEPTTDEVADEAQVEETETPADAEAESA